MVGKEFLAPARPPKVPDEEKVMNKISISDYFNQKRQDQKSRAT